MSSLARRALLSLEAGRPTDFAPPATTRVVAAAAALLLTASVQAQSDCVPYEPTGAGQVVQGVWDAAFEIDRYEITVPSDPGGGYVIARLESPAPGRPRMRIIPPSGLGVITQSAPTFPDGPSPQAIEVAFEVIPGAAYEVEIAEDAVSSSFPVNYRWNWSFVSRVDCFETNDALPSDWPAPTAVSKTVPVNEVQQAYSLAGHQSFSINPGELQNFDWYDFTLDEAAEVVLETLVVPSDQSIRIRLFDGNGDQVADGTPPVGATGAVGPISLQPGTYYLDLHPEVRGESQVTLSEGGPLPDHFETPYQFIIRTDGAPPPPPMNNCVPYQPTEAGQSFQGTWDEAFELDEYSFTVPSDPGGGYVVVRVGTEAPSRPHMRIIPPSKLGVVAQSAPTFPGGLSPQALEVAFEVAPDTTFDLEIFEDAVSSVFPVSYTWGWTFVSRVDCFEQNNALPSDWPDPIAASATVPLDEVQEAYSLGGHQTFGISGSEPQNFDWYNFTLDEPADIWMATLGVPSDQVIRVRLFDSEAGVIADGVPELAETIVVGPESLEPGTYYLDIHPEVRGLGNVALSEGEPLPDHFETPYQFIVSTTGPGFATLNGASFGSGGGLAPDSFVSGFAWTIATPTLLDSTLPEVLGGFAIQIADSTETPRNARLYVVANGQINFLMPSGLAAGPGTLTLLRDGQVLAEEAIQITDVSPGIFSAAASGTGVAAAVFLRTAPDGSRTDGLIFDENLAAVPLDFGAEGSELYVFLFGTGLRNFTGEVTVTVDGEPVPFSGPVEQGQFDGLDQLNIGPLPRSLAGRGEVEIVVTVDGIQANVVTATFQ